MYKTISFHPRGITALYLKRIEADIQAQYHCIGATALMVKLIEEYFLMRYGKEERKKIRDIYLADRYKEIDTDNDYLQKRNI